MVVIARVAYAALLALVLIACTPSEPFGRLTVTSVTPDVVSAGGGVAVTIVGTGFVAVRGVDGGGLRVLVCGVPLDQIVVEGAERRVVLPGGGVFTATVGTTLRGITRASDGTSGDVVVTRSDGRRAVLSDAVTCSEAHAPEAPGDDTEPPDGDGDEGGDADHGGGDAGGGDDAPTVAPAATGDAPADQSAPGDALHGAFQSTWSLPAPGLLANDDLGAPNASLVSFGGVDLGGSVTTFSAGTTASVDGHALSVTSDGAVTFTPAPGFSGPFSFQYRLENVAGASDASVTIAVGARPALGPDLTYPVTLLGNVGIDTRVSTSFAIAASGDALRFDLVDASGGSATVFADGTFGFDPDAGLTGTASFSVSATNGFGTTAPTTVTLHVAERIWFVSAAAGAGGDGRRSSPFDCFRGPDCPADLVIEAGDVVYLAAGEYPVEGASWTVPDGVILVGEGALRSFGELTSLAWPADAGAAPATLGGGVTLAGPADAGADPAGPPWLDLGVDVTLAGLTLAGLPGVALGGSDFGTLSVHDVAIDVAGGALELARGTLAGSGFTSLTAAGGDGRASVALVDVDTPGQGFDLGTGTLRGRPALHVAGGSGTFRYDGAIDVALTEPAAAPSVALHVRGMLAGGLTLAGAVTVGVADGVDGATVGAEALRGVVVGQQAGAATVRFDGPVAVSLPAGVAVEIDDNHASAATVFAGGLDVHVTGAAAGVRASDAGTVQLLAGGVNAIRADAGVALSLTRSAVGSAGVHLDRIDVDGSAPGAAASVALDDVRGSGGVHVRGGVVRHASSSAFSLLDVDVVVLGGVSLVATASTALYAVDALDVADLLLRDVTIDGGEHLAAGIRARLERVGGRVEIVDGAVRDVVGRAITLEAMRPAPFGSGDRRTFVVRGTTVSSSGTHARAGIDVVTNAGTAPLDVTIDVRNVSVAGTEFEAVSVWAHGDVGAVPARVDLTVADVVAAAPSDAFASALRFDTVGPSALCIATPSPNTVASIRVNHRASETLLVDSPTPVSSAAELGAFLAARNLVTGPDGVTVTGTGPIGTRSCLAAPPR